MEPSFNNIKDFTATAFNGALADNNELLKKVFAFQKDLEATNPLLKEMFNNDFSYEWNKLQVHHFLKNGILLKTTSGIKTIPSVWLMEWSKLAKKNLDKLKIEEDFDMRKYPFESIFNASKKLSLIFSHVFKKNSKQAKIAFQIKDEVLGCYTYHSSKTQNLKNGIIHFTYICSLIDSFGNKIEKPNLEQEWDDLINIYYGRHNKANEDLFTIYARSGRDVEVEKILTIKKEALQLRDEDYKYWKFFQDIDSENLFLSRLQSRIDLSQKNTQSVALEVYTKNNYELLQRTIPEKVITETLSKKTIKI